MPAGIAGSRRTATRFTSGAICLRSSTHFPLKLYSKFMKPVALPPGRARLSTRPAPTGSETPRTRPARSGWHAASLSRPRCQWPGRHPARARPGRVPAGEVDIIHAPADVHSHIATVAPAQLLQDLLECGDTHLTLWIICATIN